MGGVGLGLFSIVVQPFPGQEEPMGRASWAVAPVPPQSLLVMSPEKRKLAAQEGRPAEPPPEEQVKEKPHTLEEFSYEFFRCPPPTHTPEPQPQPAPLCTLRSAVHLASPGRKARL